MIQARRLPMRAVISWVTENVVRAVASTPFNASGLGRWEAMLFPKAGSSTPTMTRPMKSPFKTLPAMRPTGRRKRRRVFFSKNQAKKVRMKLPAMMAGNIRGIPAMIGEPAMKNAVMGVTTQRMAAQGSPAVRAQRIRQALMTGPVI